MSTLTAYLRERASPFADVRGAMLLKGGQSNPTYKLDTAAGPVVLRMRPIGAGKWAHDVGREFKVLNALQNTNVPVPKPYLYCDSEAVIGGAFYLMQFVEGRIIDDCTLPGLSAPERRAVYKSFTEAFAALHAVDYQAVGLADFGKPADFVARQLKLHSAKFLEYEPAGNPDMAWLAEHLPRHIPPQTHTAIIHNDIRVGNVVLHPTEPKVIAILDWEMSTLGDPWADAALIALPYFFVPGNPQGTFAGVDTQNLGLPTVEELLGWYCAARGFSAFAHFRFMTAFNLFRYASVYAGIAARFRAGIAVSADAAGYADVVAPTARQARILAEAALNGA
ncbi:MAG: phosphotransferase family protein [Rhodospirillaceae bacterium]|nr:phosphotransferase family protein [Rhodospirillaceae bacterium]